MTAVETVALYLTIAAAVAILVEIVGPYVITILSGSSQQGVTG